MPEWLQSPPGIITALLSFAAVIGASWLTYRSTTRAKAIEANTPPYEALATRVGVLETQVEGMRREREQMHAERDEDRAFIRALLSERPRGLPIPQPAPRWLWAASAPTPTTIIE